ncbi:NUDIX hydrolase [Streptomyces sp. NBC_01803]|uniref:NUDIX hydrolase n=1 Tax=Streptomyces sp. NBC_01803 TaxID=2975946 RepID=UPI002DDB896A|nr:NUDIX hydrolase [Streptomyces sp. NBC_01803]WSA42758.1 NUDIX hydrolase [Streptomyces sp. NBC_01803]
MNDKQVSPPTRLRASAGAVFFNHQGDILLVNPTYKPYWNLPGGQVDCGESPRNACSREVREELGIEPEIGLLLTVSWTGRAGQEDRIYFVFEGGELSPAEQAAITLQESELSEFAFYPPQEIDASVVPPHLADILRVTLRARSEKKTSYIEIGN